MADAYDYHAFPAAPLSTSFVQPVPDHCDRILWRGAYYPLPPSPPAAPLTWNELRPLMVAVMETDETCRHLRGTSNWAAAIAKAVIAVHGITTHKDAP